MLTCENTEHRNNLSPIPLPTDGTAVDDTFCTKQKNPSNDDPLYDWFNADQLTRSCRVPCPGQCLATEWSSWSSCHADCEAGTRIDGNSPGVKTRSRVQYVVGDVSLFLFRNFFYFVIWNKGF